MATIIPTMTTITAVTIEPTNFDDHRVSTAEFDVVLVKKAIFDGPGWTDSTCATAVFGTPVKFRWWPSDNQEICNRLSKCLFLKIDPSSIDGFGSIPDDPSVRKMKGTVVVARKDGVALGREQVRGALRYLGSLDEVVDTHRTAEFDDDQARLAAATQLAGDIFTNQAFRTWLKNNPNLK